MSCLGGCSGCCVPNIFAKLQHRHPRCQVLGRENQLKFCFIQFQ